MNNIFKITLFASVMLQTICFGQTADSTKNSVPFAFGKGQFFLSPGFGVAKDATSFGASLEYGLTNVVGINVGISNFGLMTRNDFYSQSKSVRASAIGLGLKLHTGFQKKQNMFDIAPEISFSKLLKDNYYIVYPKVGIGAGLDVRFFVSKVVALNFTAGKALNGAKKWGFGGGLTFRLIHKPVSKK